MKLSRTVGLAVAVSLVAATVSASYGEDKTIRIGFQKYGKLVLLKGKGTLEGRLKAIGYSVEWKEFPAGPQLLEALMLVGFYRMLGGFANTLGVQRERGIPGWPAPEPPLKISPSSRYQLRIDSMVSSTARMKHADTCCGEAVPTLNQTGELKLNIW